MQAQRETVGLANGGQPYRSTGSKPDPIERAPALAEAGFDKHLADRAIMRLVRSQVDDPYLPGQQAEDDDAHHEGDREREPHCLTMSGFS